MKLNNNNGNNNPVDPIEMLAGPAIDRIWKKVEDLEINLKRRREHYQGPTKASHSEIQSSNHFTSEEAETIALLERLAFYEITIDALIARMNELENRLGGKFNHQN